MKKTPTTQKKSRSKELAKQTAHIVESLPADKAEALLDYATYLAERAEEAEWDRRFSDPKYQPKLKAKLAEVKRRISAGGFEPLDPSLL